MMKGLGYNENLQDNSSGAIDVIVKLEANKDNAGFIIKKVKELGRNDTYIIILEI